MAVVYVSKRSLSWTSNRHWFFLKSEDYLTAASLLCLYVAIFAGVSEGDESKRFSGLHLAFICIFGFLFLYGIACFAIAKIFKSETLSTVLLASIIVCLSILLPIAHEAYPGVPISTEYYLIVLFGCTGFDLWILGLCSTLSIASNFLSAYLSRVSPEKEVAFCQLGAMLLSLILGLLLHHFAYVLGCLLLRYRRYPDAAISEFPLFHLLENRLVSLTARNVTNWPLPRADGESESDGFGAHRLNLKAVQRLEAHWEDYLRSSLGDNHPLLAHRGTMRRDAVLACEGDHVLKDGDGGASTDEGHDAAEKKYVVRPLQSKQTRTFQVIQDARQMHSSHPDFSPREHDVPNVALSSAIPPDEIDGTNDVRRGGTNESGRSNLTRRVVQNAPVTGSVQPRMSKQASRESEGRNRQEDYELPAPLAQRTENTVNHGETYSRAESYARSTHEVDPAKPCGPMESVVCCPCRQAVKVYSFLRRRRGLMRRATWRMKVPMPKRNLTCLFSESRFERWYVQWLHGFNLRFYKYLMWPMTIASIVLIAQQTLFFAQLFVLEGAQPTSSYIYMGVRFGVQIPLVSIQLALFFATQRTARDSHKLHLIGFLLAYTHIFFTLLDSGFFLMLQANSGLDLFRTTFSPFTMVTIACTMTYITMLGRLPLHLFLHLFSLVVVTTTAGILKTSLAMTFRWGSLFLMVVAFNIWFTSRSVEINRRRIFSKILLPYLVYLDEVCNCLQQNEDVARQNERINEDGDSFQIDGGPPVGGVVGVGRG
eukprot:GHVN01055979.1.p1 GENE.GHVN01055979.1~~GHVN01055979.1.p1  ORF type:complete len:766 (+),score=38.92 GHVN01055979.1:65-2362(+)